MSEDTKQPDAIGPGESDAPTEPDSPGTPPPSAIPSAGVLAGADEEKASMVEQAKTRVAAVKESLAAKPTDPGAPKPPVKKKEEGPKPTDASGHPLFKRLRTKFGDAVSDPLEFIGQLSIRVERERISKFATFSKEKRRRRSTFFRILRVYIFRIIRKHLLRLFITCIPFPVMNVCV